MPSDPLFAPLTSATQVATVTIHFNRKPLEVRADCNLAAALLQAGVRRFRNSPVSGGGRAPYCMMGVCFECLLTVDGTPNRQGCLVQVEPGMSVSTQDGLAGVLTPRLVTPAATAPETGGMAHGR